MKRFTYYMYLLLFISFACDDDTPKPKEESEALVGKWEWVESSGGIAGSKVTPASESHTKTILFTSDGNYEEYINGQKTKATNYEIVEGASIFSRDLCPIIQYSDENFPKQSFTLKDNDTLYLKDECYDCYSHIFVKKK